MKFHGATIGTTLFVAGLAIGFGTHSAMSPTKLEPVAVASSQPHTATLSEHTDAPTPVGNNPVHALAVPDLEALVAEASALWLADQKAMSERYNTYRRPIPDDWEGIKALSIEENVEEINRWSDLDRLEAEVDRLLREEPTNAGDLQLRRSMVQNQKDVIIENLKKHLRVPLDEDAEYRVHQTGDFRYNRIIDALLGPEQATLCAKDDASCTPPIRVNFLCDMSQILICHQVARAIRASEDFFLMYPFDAKGVGASLDWDATLVYSDFGYKIRQTGSIHSLIVTNSQEHDSTQFILNRNNEESYATPEHMMMGTTVGSYRIDPKTLNKILETIKKEKE